MFATSSKLIYFRSYLRKDACMPLPCSALCPKKIPPACSTTISTYWDSKKQLEFDQFLIELKVKCSCKVWWLWSRLPFESVCLLSMWRRSWTLYVFVYEQKKDNFCAIANCMHFPIKMNELRSKKPRWTTSICVWIVDTQTIFLCSCISINVDLSIWVSCFRHMSHSTHAEHVNYYWIGWPSEEGVKKEHKLRKKFRLYTYNILYLHSTLYVRYSHKSSIKCHLLQ